MKTKTLKSIIEQHPDLYGMTPTEAARELKQNHGRTEKRDTLRKQIARLHGTGWTPANHAEQEVTRPTGICELAQDYYYNKVDDKYLILASGQAYKTVIDGEVVRTIQRQYSNMGSGDSVNEIAREYGWTPDFFNAIRRALRMTHASLPLTHEEVASTIDDPQAEQIAHQNMVMLQGQKLHRKAQRAIWKQTEQDAHRWREFEQGRLQPLINHIEANPPRRRVFQIAGQPQPYRVLFNASDVHIGALGIHGEGLAETHHALMQTTEQLIARVAERGRPEEIVVVLNGDWFHADTPQGSTTRGTPLDMACTPDEAFNVGCDIAIEYIDRLRSLGDLTVYVVRGNHDNMTSLALNRVLIEAYKRCEGVSVVEASCEPWYMIALGKAHLYFEHGDGPKGAKITPIMAKVGKDLWGCCNHHYAFTGHLHHMKVLDDYGVVHIQMPSLARPDRYHAKGGWLTATRAQEAYVFDGDGFLFDTVRALGG